MFQFEFMRLAFVVGIILAVTIPLVGSTTVFKRLSLSGDALAHTSLAGVAIGLAAGLNPLLISIITCIIAFLIIELIRKKFQKYSELGVAVVLSAGIGIAGIMSSFTTAANFDSYLFGSIVLISSLELWLVIGLFVAVVLFYVVFYDQILSVLYDEAEARTKGINTNFINVAQALLMSITIAISAKTIGSLVVSSLMVLPVAASLQISRSYRTTIVSSILFSLFSVITGLTISYYADLRPGATIVMVSIGVLICCMAYKAVDGRKKKVK